jgi:hypothetical protein
MLLHTHTHTHVSLLTRKRTLTYIHSTTLTYTYVYVLIYTPEGRKNVTQKCLSRWSNLAGVLSEILAQYWREWREGLRECSRQNASRLVLWLFACAYVCMHMCMYVMSVQTVWVYIILYELRYTVMNVLCNNVRIKVLCWKVDLWCNDIH